MAHVPLGVEGDALGPGGLGLKLGRSAGRNGMRWWGTGGEHALVNMEGVDMMVRTKPQLQGGADNFNREKQWQQTRGRVCIRRRKGNRVGVTSAVAAASAAGAVSSPNAMCPREFYGSDYPICELAPYAVDRSQPHRLRHHKSPKKLHA
jgi:hypothetical protein